MTSPRVSIITTAYNVAPFIEQAVRSALAQTFADIEVIVVNDASTDATAEILNTISDPRLRIITNPENLGAGQSRRVGIAAAKGQFIQLLDGDDYLDPSFIEALLKRQEETNAPIVSGGITIDNGQGAYDTHVYGIYEASGIDDIIRWFGRRTLFLNNMLIARNIFDTVEYSPRRYIEDTQVFLAILYTAERIAYTDHTGYFYRMRHDSLTHTADPVKDTIYRTLCATDIVKFFADKDPRMQQMFSNELFASCLNALKNIHPTPEQLAPYSSELTELMTFILSI